MTLTCVFILLQCAQYSLEPFLVQIHLFNQNHAKFLMTLNGKI